MIGWKEGIREGQTEECGKGRKNGMEGRNEKRMDGRKEEW